MCPGRVSDSQRDFKIEDGPGIQGVSLVFLPQSPSDLLGAVSPRGSSVKD